LIRELRSFGYPPRILSAGDTFPWAPAGANRRARDDRGLRLRLVANPCSTALRGGCRFYATMRAMADDLTLRELDLGGLNARYFVGCHISGISMHG